MAREIMQRMRRLALPSLGHSYTSCNSQKLLAKTLFNPSISTFRRVISIGILREDYDKWERRAPLSPYHVKNLIDTFKNEKIDEGGILSNIFIQPSSRRIFPDAQYKAAGAIVSNDLTDADVILGVKRVADDATLLNGKSYMFFSHVIKGQPENMRLLQAILDKKIQLFDYEAIGKDVYDPSTGETKKRRLVAFGKYAGIAGMIDSFQALGRRLLASGYSTPFLNCSPAYVYFDLDQAKQGVTEMGKRIEEDGLPAELEPLIFAFTGNGNVTNGALEIFKLMPHKMVSLSEAMAIKNVPGPHKCVYGLMVDQEDMVRKRNCYDPFDLNHYRTSPAEYEAIFHRTVAPFCNVLINGIYWDERYPRILSKANISELYKSGKRSLFVVGDISCDINGSIEFLERTTTIDKPYFLWDPISNEAVDEIGDNGVVVMGVDILPTELSVESSRHFGDSLLPLLKQLITNGYENSKIGRETLPVELANACITQDGSLTPSFKYIEALMKRSHGQETMSRTRSGPYLLLHIKGHIFDSGLVNQLFDVIEGLHCHFDIEKCVVKPTVDGVREMSTLLLRVFSDEDEKLDVVLRKVNLLLDLIESAEATMQHYEHFVKPLDPKHSSDRNKAFVLSEREKKILVLGAGRVASSLAEYLGRSQRTMITVASQNETEALAVATNAARGKAEVCDLSQPGNKLKHLVADADIVISLLPAHMHPSIADVCISSKTDLVTASYESDEMRALRSRCEESGVTILNEVGLDPGMDHMSAMKIIDDVHLRGGKITSFSSVCGGLPAPEAANNPLLYKFSWSPMGVMKASQNDATYRRDGKTVRVDGAALLATAEPFGAWQSLRLECIPNRDSLVYGEKYGIQSAETIFRGTLRYHGFSGLLNVFRNMGLLGDRGQGAMTWIDVLKNLQASNGFSDLRSFILFCSGGDKNMASKAYDCLCWLGLNTKTHINDPSSVVRSFCDVLEEHLKFKAGERDMVLMHHTIKAAFDDSYEIHTCSLQLLGDERMTAMCKTVGFTAGIGAKLILEGKITEKGLLLPTSKEIYSQSLDLLASDGIVFDEKVRKMDKSVAAY